MSITERISVHTDQSPAQRFREVRELTDLLADRLSPEDQTPQSMTEASPAKWHRAHVTWFFEEFILRRDPGYVVYDESYRYLFNSYYEAVGERHPRPDRGLVTRPGVDDITHYRNYVDAAMESALTRGALDDAALDLVELGCNHEQQHQELLLMDVKHLFSTIPLTPGPIYVDRELDAPSAPGPMTWRSVAGGVTEVAPIREPDSPTTTRVRGIESSWRTSRSPSVRSPTPTGWSSSPTTAIGARVVVVRRVGAPAAGRLAGSGLLAPRRRRAVDDVHAFGSATARSR